MFSGRVAYRDVQDRFSRQAVLHHQGVRKCGDRIDLFSQPKFLEDVKRIRPNLYACTDLSKGISLLAYTNRYALARQRQGRREAANAAACNDDRKRGVVRVWHD